VHDLRKPTVEYRTLRYKDEQPYGCNVSNPVWDPAAEESAPGEYVRDQEREEKDAESGEENDRICSV